MKKKLLLLMLIFFVQLSSNYFVYQPLPVTAAGLEIIDLTGPKNSRSKFKLRAPPGGKFLFEGNCNNCHKNGKNLIIPEKNLGKEALEVNGMNTVDAIIYQIKNGKNGMPAFGGRLTETEMEKIATYVLENALKIEKISE